MGGIALLARELGHEVQGSDAGVYPPMSTQLEAHGIEVHTGYRASILAAGKPDLVIVGNALSRGNEAVEYLLNEGLPYLSGPQWLEQTVLAGRHVLAVAGTHGKTTTSALLAWILESAGRAPGFLVGGMAENFGLSARLGTPGLFVVEADEYDTAFFDKRSKFVHYRPKTLIINNIEYDHADIFGDLAAIRRQFHQLVRMVPGSGNIIIRAGDHEIREVLQMGCWTPVETFGEAGDWNFAPLCKDWSAFEIRFRDSALGRVEWGLIGRHNAENALAAIVAGAAVGVQPNQACRFAGEFKSTRRRLQFLGSINGISVHDDFAHHPTAIRATLAALRQNVDGDRIIALVELRSNTMKLGVHKDELGPALAEADRVFVFRPAGLRWDLDAALSMLGDRCRVCDTVAGMIDETASTARPGDHVLIMSNGEFEGIQQRLLRRLRD